ncbi:MAG TPA: NADH-quinone oxidoreductase subunit N [Candidatus Binatus sp.]|nr:NADH-quinone oxidoreductase subunit N [Candidatus Binatus sp.]
MSLIQLIPLVSLAAFGLLAPPAGLFRGGNTRLRLAPYLGIAGLLISLGSLSWFLLVNYQPSVFGSAGVGVLRFDTFTYLFGGILIATSTIVAFASLGFTKNDPNEAPYYGLLLLSTLGMVILAASQDLILLYVGWELMSVPTYALTAIKKRDVLSNEAAMKFFVLSAMSSALLVYAISLIYGMTGSTNLLDIRSTLGTILTTQPGIRPYGVIAIVLFIVGFGVKMAVVPFHMWIPDAFEGAPSTISALLASGAKLAAFGAAFRVFIFGMGTFNVDWYSTFAIVAVVTMTLGNVAALMQKSFTRLLAYSSIPQAGYVLIALAVTTPSNTLGLAGAIFHSLNYGILKTAAFIAAAAVATRLPVTDVASFNGLSKRMPQTAFAITVIFLALAGVPPLNGFFSKAVLFTGALNSQFSWGAWLAIAALLNSGFSMGYYGWVIKRMYLDDPTDPSRLPEPASYTRVLWLVVILAFIIGLYPQPWISLSQDAANSLIAIVG